MAPRLWRVGAESLVPGAAPGFAPSRPLRGTSIWRDLMTPADWTGSAGGVVTADPVNVLASTRVSGAAFSPASIDFSTDPTHITPMMYRHLGAAVDLSASSWHLGVRFFIPPDQLTYWNSIIIKLAQETNFATKYATCSVMVSAAMNNCSGGWWEAVVTKGQFAVAGGWDWTNFQYAYVTGVLADLGGGTYHAANIVVDEIEILNPLTKGLIFITCDDAFDDQYNLALYCAGKGVPITLYVPKVAYETGGIGASGFLTLAQLQHLSRNPLIEIANHSWTHRITGDGLTWPDGWADDEVIRMAEWMIQNDLARGAFTYASPGGRWPTDALTAYLGRACATYRLWKGGFGAAEGVWRNPIIRGTRSDKTDGGVTTATHTAHMDDAATWGGVYCGVFHYTDGSTGYFTEAEMKTIIDYAAACIAAGTHVAGTMGQLPDLVEKYRT